MYKSLMPVYFYDLFTICLFAMKIKFCLIANVFFGIHPALRKFELLLHSLIATVLGSVE